METGQWKNLMTKAKVAECVKQWLQEDTPGFDYGGFVVGESVESAVLLCKSPGVLSGVPFFEEVFRQLDCEVQWKFEEGAMLDPICKVAFVHGKVKNILLGERVALNLLTRSSGISTQCRRLQGIKQQMIWQGTIAGTRKTTPGFRIVEKYALLVGGASTHRYDLSSMVMLKDNHIWSVGNIENAVKKARGVCGFSTKIEVECRTIEDAKTAANAGAEVVMLDNFDPEALHVAAAEVKASFPNIIIEASGGINEKVIENFMGPDVDVISMGCLTQGYPVVDFSLKIIKDGKNPENPIVTSSNA
eukprot:Seg1089.2 transcript_id=Seg1089.2/GoldUCD/mRNA.D3Y31 product="Nicotinate-nucleotide pyrophosphorylase" protein_id=Seg1089.2/GoldUCD/D3Y31